MVPPRGFEPLTTGPKPVVLSNYTTGADFYKLYQIFIKKSSPPSHSAMADKPAPIFVPRLRSGQK